MKRAALIFLSTTFSVGAYVLPQSTPRSTVVTSAIPPSSPERGRREFLIATSYAASLSSLGFPSNVRAEDGDTKMTEEEGVVMFKTPTGLKYIELEPGDEDSKSPRYGQICVISYKAYLKLPNGKTKEQFDSSDGYVIKHGNGKMVPGLDEGLHTMKMGGLRRLIIPPKLGFIESGLGPLPAYPWDRVKLNHLLEEMIKQRGGNLVFDVRLKNFFDDEADQGYYEDLEISDREKEEIQRRLLRQETPNIDSESASNMV